MFNVKNLASVVVAATTLSIMSPDAEAAQSTATVNVTATVVDNTCTPEWDAKGVNVELNRVSTKDFAGGSGAIGKEQQFHLKLKNCGSGATKVKVTASGTPDGTNKDLFQNSNGGAKNVAVGIWGGDTQATSMKPDGSGEVEYAIANSAADMVFLAKLMQTGADVPTPGQVKSTVTLTVSYQ